ncbi:helix-turn-helix domain-containing protein [Leptolyngbya sp. FACHB-36]|uniref:PucR family transcriptional regulator n=1 Tax=Leptolyngbya sp. FACHB-36 TaxID=2692808 RepID=UPI0016809E5A|nr:helix-turn-helix domain-containing protein [Leptolyngbya sp. FACHB-36]MBD2021714.1 helix-turn-helix domain-containing protein [Leptolyngbya sp. FACHB-36]
MIESMLTASVQFAQVATIVTRKVAKLLFAPVFVADDRSVVIASSEAEWVGRTFSRQDSTSHEYLRVPLRYDGETGEVIVGRSHSREAISSRLARVLVELVINQTIIQDQVPSQHELKNQLIHELLCDRIENETVILSRAKRLGIDLTPPRAVILIDAADYISTSELHPEFDALDAEQQRRAQVVIGSIVSFFYLPSDTICADLGQGRIAVLKASDSKNLDPWADVEDGADGGGSSWANLVALRRAADALLIRLRSDTGGAAINVGIGRYHPGIRGLARSYEDARAALSLGSRFQGHNQVHCLGRLGIAAFVGVADESTKIDLAKYLLSPLDHEPELLTTLNAFFAEDCCPSSAAKRLSIHRNTLSYRLDKIASLTGLEPRRFDDAVQMRLSLLLRSLQSARSA